MLDCLYTWMHAERAVTCNNMHVHMLVLSCIMLMLQKELNMPTHKHRESNIHWISVFTMLQHWWGAAHAIWLTEVVVSRRCRPQQFLLLFVRTWRHMPNTQHRRYSLMFTWPTSIWPRLQRPTKRRFCPQPWRAQSNLHAIHITYIYRANIPYTHTHTEKDDDDG